MAACKAAGTRRRIPLSSPNEVPSQDASGQAKEARQHATAPAAINPFFPASRTARPREYAGVAPRPLEIARVMRAADKARYAV